ncbi:N-acyl amino acid synthase FeeM domain-containing protein [Sphingomonas natans]|uniref:N-acyl amino acid synthase FeeM domain-containing protein n=1 Tax=Sphingomonas natans TaxID=3063330 RepID=UPI003D66CE93
MTGHLPDRVQIELAEREALRAEASALLSRLYEPAGYAADHDADRGEHKIPFVVRLDGATIGTLTLGVDSTAGLAIDATFGEEVAALRRRPGARLCELTTLAFDAAESRPLLAALFGAILRHGSEHYGCTDVLIEVSPIHRRFYERMLGFEVFAAPKISNRSGTTVVPMRIEVTPILCRAAEKASHSFHAAFASNTDFLQLSASAPSASRDIRR